MEFRVLGPLEVVEGDHRYSLGGPKQRAALALLISSAKRPVSVGTLIDSIYGDEASDRAHRSIHTFVSNLRSELGDVIEGRGEGYVFLAERAAVDAYRFEDEVTAAMAEDDPARAAELLKAALAIWRGHAFADIEARGTLSAEVTRLDELRVVATEQRIDAELASGRHAALIAELESLTIEYPLREHFWAQHMIALYRAGRQAEALRAYSRARGVLVDQTGLEPSPELRDLEGRILSQDPSLQLGSLPLIRRVSILVADVADPAALARLDPVEREVLISDQTRALHSAVAAHAGEVFAHRGSAVYAMFDDVADATNAAIAAQLTLVDLNGLMRMAIDHGDVEQQTGSGASGPAVNRAAILAGSAHGGQILLSSKTQAALADVGASEWAIRALGPHSFVSIDEPVSVYQLVVADLPSVFHPLRMEAIPPAVPGAAKALPGYELREQIGSGAFGVVHRAYQPSIGREVAIKIIRPELANDPDFVRRFEVEAQLVARLEHPHLIPLYDYWREPDGAYLVMRWVRGGNLASLIDKGTLSTDVVGSILAQLAPALDYAHRHGVAHRDIKPANVLLDDDGNAYLTDFGIARGSAGEADRASDVVALGRLVAQCLGDDAVADSVELFTSDVHSGRLIDVDALLEAWAAAVGDTGDLDRSGFTSTRNPYKGLSAFGELDAADFHGRDDEIEQLLTAIDQRNLVAVVGPSGIGKSSVVRAGLLPALRAGALTGSERWLITDMMPGPYPIEELATALHRVATEASVDIEQELRRGERGLVRAVRRAVPDGLHVVIVIDQFEELFTLVEDETQQQRFLDLLMTAIADEHSELSIVLTLRADFFDRPLRFGEFGDVLRGATVPIAAPTEDDLRAIITAPADGAGVSFDSGLVERMVSDVKDQPGALPLLEFSLTELFAGRESDLLRAAGYEEAGGIQGALGRRAESIFESLDQPTREVARQVFLRLVTLPDAERVTRRRVRRAELNRLGETKDEVDAVLGAFERHRILVSDRDPLTHGPTVEVAHEAIFAEWARLRDWIAERRRDLRARQRLLEAVEDWDDSGRQEALLLTGSRLGQMEHFVAATDLSLGKAELDLVQVSTDRRNSERLQKRRVRRRVLAGFAAAAVVASIFAVVAVLQRSRATQAHLEATAGELSAQAVLQLADDPELSVLLGLEAVHAAQGAGIDVFDSTSALRAALSADRILERYEGGYFVTADSGGSVAVTGSADGRALVRDLGSGEVLATLDRPGVDAIGAALSPDKTEVAVLYAAADMPIWIWAIDGTQHRELAGPDTSHHTSPFFFSYDESGRIAAGVDEIVYVWSVDTLEQLMSLEIAGGVEFVSGTDLLVVSDVRSAQIRVFDLAGDEEVLAFPIGSRAFSFAVSPGGDLVVVAHGNAGLVEAYDLRTGDWVWGRGISRPFGVEWIPESRSVAVGSEGGGVIVLDAESGDIAVRLEGGHRGAALSLAATTDGRLVTSGRADGQTIVWDVNPGPRAEVDEFDLVAAEPRFVGFAPYPSGVFVSTLGPPARARILDAANGDVIHEVADPLVGNDGQETVVSPGGLTLIETTPAGRSLVRDTRTLDEVYIAPPEMEAILASADGRIALIDDFTDPTRPLRVIDLHTGQVISTINRIPFSFPFPSPDGSLVVGWNADDETEVYRTSDGAHMVTVPAAMVSFLPDGERAAVIDPDGVLWLVDRAKLLEGASLAAAEHWHSFAVQGQPIPPSVVSSDDSALLAVTARTGEPVTVWDTTEGSRVAEIESGQSVAIPYIFFHPDEPHVTLVSDDGRLLTYTLDVNELVRIAESRVTRSLTDAECLTFLRIDVCPDRGSE